MDGGKELGDADHYSGICRRWDLRRAAGAGDIFTAVVGRVFEGSIRIECRNLLNKYILEC